MEKMNTEVGATRLFAVVLVLAAGAANAFAPNVTFWVDVPVINPIILYRNFSTTFPTPGAPDPFVGQIAGTGGGLTVHATNITTFDSIAWLEFYGAALTLDGSAPPVTDPRLFIDGALIQAPGDVAGPTLYKVDQLSWNFHKPAYQVKGGTPPPQVSKFSYLTGMQTQAPSLQESNKLVVPFAKDGKVNEDLKSYVSFPWDKYSTEVLTKTPTIGGQTAQPCDAIRIPNFLQLDPLVIRPPANTSYFILNATVTDDASIFHVLGEPGLPGRNSTLETNMYLGASDFVLADVQAFQTPLDPTVQYNITIVVQDITQAQNPVFNSMTFISGLWGTQPNTTDANGASSVAPSPSGNTTAATAVPAAGAGSKSNTGAIAGGVVGGVLGAALIAAVAFFLIRRKRNMNKKSVADDFQVDESPGDDSAMRQPTPFMASASNAATPISPKSPYMSVPINGRDPSTTSGNGDSTPITTSSPWSSDSPSSPVVAGGGATAAAVAKEHEVRPPPHAKSSAATTTTEPSTLLSPIAPSHVRQEQDLGYIEPEEVVPPSYNPQWEEDARKRAQRRQ